MKKLTRVGLFISSGWSFIFLGIVLLKSACRAEMGLNEWGDFIAGASAPLALLWLVIGYFQQGEELRLNTKALMTQQEELRRQVEETALLAKSSERQAVAAELLAHVNKSEAEKEEQRIKRDAQPSFWPSGGSASSRTITTNIVNEGGTAFDAKLMYSGPLNLKLTSVEGKWEKGQTGKLVLHQHRDELPQYPFEFVLVFSDKFGEAQEKRFVYESQHKFGENVA